MKYYVISIKILHLLYDLLPNLIVPEHKHTGKSPSTRPSRLTRIDGIPRHYNTTVFVFGLYRSFKNMEWAGTRVASTFSTIFYEWR